MEFTTSPVMSHLYIYIIYGYIKYPCVDNCVPLSICIVKCTGVPEFPIYLSSFLSILFNCVTIQNIENVFFKLILLCCILTCGMSLPVCVDIKSLARNRCSSSADALELPRSCAGLWNAACTFPFWVVHCGMYDGWIVGLVRLVSCYFCLTHCCVVHMLLMYVWWYDTCMFTFSYNACVMWLYHEMHIRL